MPTVRQPFSFAIWPTQEPTAPARRRHDHGLAGSRLAELQQAVMRRDAVDARGRPARSESGRSVLLDSAARSPPASSDGVVLPAEHARDRRAHRHTIGIVRGDDAAGGERAHHGADRHRFRIVGDRVDPAAHRRLDRQPGVSHQDTCPGPGTGTGVSDDPEMLPPAGMPSGRLPGSTWRFTVGASCASSPSRFARVAPVRLLL